MEEPGLAVNTKSKEKNTPGSSQKCPRWGWTRLAAAGIMDLSLPMVGWHWRDLRPFPT